MAQMEAVVLDAWSGDLDVRTVARPDPAAGEVRVEVKACGVTRTVENAVQGGFADDDSLLPRIPGHEFAGVVDAVGDGVEHLAVGDRVLAYFYLVCGTCPACRRGEANRCTAFDGWLGVQRDGAYAEYTTLPAANALPLPDDASFVDGAIAADGLATPLHVCDRTGIDDTDVVAVVGGAGRIGAHITQLAAARGAHVLGIEVTDARLDAVVALANARGIDARVTAIDGRGDLAAALQEAAPRTGGPTVVVDAVGDVDTLQSTWDALAMGGQVVTLTTHHDRAFAPPLKDFVVDEASLVGSRYATMDEVVRAAELLADDAVHATHAGRISLDDLPDYHASLRAGETHGMAILEP